MTSRLGTVGRMASDERSSAALRIVLEQVQRIERIVRGSLALARGVRGARPAGIAWNVLGLLDLVVAVGMGTALLAPLLAPELGRVPPVPAMGVFPLILVPAFAVPVSVLLHVLALARLLRVRDWPRIAGDFPRAAPGAL